MIIRCTIVIISLAISGVMIRGGFQQIPHTSAVAFFSHNSTENYAAVNKVRYFIDSYIQSKSIKHIELPNSETIVSNNRNRKKGSSFIASNQPNITLIVMEGIPNAIFDSSYQIHIPNLRRFKKSSYSFENMYASGFRTDQGILSLLGGIPAYPYINVMKDVEAIHEQPSLFRTLKNHGYYTSFLYGGDGQFSHLKKYMMAQQVDHYSDESNYEISDRTMEWGVPDHVLLQRATTHLKSIDRPQFTTILTSSTHQPFDFPGNKSGEKTLIEDFIGSVEYLDQAIGEFIDSILIEDDKNLIIITADHGCLYLGHHFNDHKRFNVPFLLLGNALSDSLMGTKNFNYYNTHDLPKSLESTLKITSENYPLSSDLTSSANNSSAYWITEHTMGWLTPLQSIVSNHGATEVYFHSNKDTPTNTQQQNALEYLMASKYYLRSCMDSPK